MPRTHENGFTLIELLVAMVIASILGVAIMSTYTTQVRAKNTQEILTDMNQTARAVMELMTQEIRLVGLDPSENAGARIDTAGVGELIFSMDRGDAAVPPTHAPNGDCCDGNEQVRYHLTNDGDDNGVNDDMGECHLGRETGTGLIAALGCGGGTGGLQPLARNVDALNFVYLDATGTSLATPVADTNDIRSIEVTIVARAGTQSGGFMYSFTNNDAYNNQQGTEILPAQGDAFRRLRLTTTIACRNM